MNRETSNFKEEVICGCRISAERKQLWAVLLDMLEVFLSICNQHGLRYFAVEGTLLGAVRHRGFIPWDDDIDLAMPRKDFERFLRLAPKALPSHISLHHKRITPDSPWYFHAKLRNNRTTFIEPQWAHLNINHGIFIDIFPMDGLPIGGKRLRRFEIIRELLGRMDRKRRLSLSQCPTLRSKLLLLPVSICSTFWGDNVFINLLERLLMINDFDDTQHEIHIWYRGVDRGKHDRRNFDGYAMVDFEGLKLRAPAGYEAYLAEEYGDYKSLPPLDKRCNPHASFIDCHHPYTDYFPYTQLIEGLDSAASRNP